MTAAMTQKRIVGLPAKSRSVAEHLLAEAGLKAGIEAAQVLGIGSAGLNVRGNRDEDGTHTRLVLDDGTSVMYREYATTSQASDLYLRKEMAVMTALREARLPAPVILAWVGSSKDSEGDPAAMLLSDGGGEPLEEVFRSIPRAERAPLWAEVGKQLKSLHSVNVSRLEFLNEQYYQRPWTRTVPYFKKGFGNLKKTRPELALAIEELMTLLAALDEYLEGKPRRVCFGGYSLPGMLMSRKGASRVCQSWLSLGYYVSINDPDRDVVSIGVHHREWTGEDLPEAFFEAYGSRPDPISELFYGAIGMVRRGAAYLDSNSGLMRKGFGPPPHSTAVQQLHQLPDRVRQLRDLLEETRNR
jgi:aminoglycoside phosphotransferase